MRTEWVNLAESENSVGHIVNATQGFPRGSAVKNLPAMQEPQETWIHSLGREDPLEEGKATHSSILAWRIPWTEEPGGLQSMESHLALKRLSTHTHTHTHAQILPRLVVITFISGKVKEVP